MTQSSSQISHRPPIKEESPQEMEIQMMTAAIDGTLDKEEVEEESEDLTNQVVDEINVGVSSHVGFS
ncbi:unnamed protein product [Brassica rapa subsp. trilocularis]